MFRVSIDYLRPSLIDVKSWGGGVIMPYTLNEIKEQMEQVGIKDLFGTDRA